MDKFILEIPRYKQSGADIKLRINEESYAALANVCARTAIPMSQVASKAILYAIQNMEIKPTDRNEKESE